MKLLIVDDEPIILRGIVQIISEAIEQIDIVAVSNGPEALKQLESLTIDLIITDVNMPVMSGLELIEECKKRNNCDRFVILTGYDEFEYARQALRLGVQDYLLKPLQKEELLAIIAEVSMDLGATDSNKNLKHTIVDYIHEHYDRDLSLDEVAAHAGIHPNYLCAIMKRDLATSFVTYLRELRIKQAKQLLRTQIHLPIDQISAAVGYDRPRQFFKVFKKVTGMTPGQYRDSEVV
ncbi:response regulator [Paenibacillus yanchengensis]|uniref:Response regulator n=1 Tax=Paenibacillus yanchengensis TaxID=2035833 RepID=A0ABW4YIJ8_9BACL